MISRIAIIGLPTIGIHLSHVGHPIGEERQGGGKVATMLIGNRTQIPIL
jgi:hypothetical protein